MVVGRALEKVPTFAEQPAVRSKAALTEARMAAKMAAVTTTGRASCKEHGHKQELAGVGTLRHRMR